MRPCACSRSSTTNSPRPGRSKVKTRTRMVGAARRARARCEMELAAVNGLAAESAGYCSIGRDERHIRSQTQSFEQRHGVGHAPAVAMATVMPACCAARSAWALRGLIACAKVATVCRPYRLPPGGRRLIVPVYRRLRWGWPPAVGLVLSAVPDPSGKIWLWNGFESMPGGSCQRDRGGLVSGLRRCADERTICRLLARMPAYRRGRSSWHCAASASCAGRDYYAAVILTRTAAPRRVDARSRGRG